jgi:hypothetical protein
MLDERNILADNLLHAFIGSRLGAEEVIDVPLLYVDVLANAALLGEGVPLVGEDGLLVAYDVSVAAEDFTADLHMLVVNASVRGS